jgi:hypothetical protein
VPLEQVFADQLAAIQVLLDNLLYSIAAYAPYQTGAAPNV